MIKKITSINNILNLFFRNKKYKFYILIFALFFNGILEGLSLSSIPLLLHALLNDDTISIFITNLGIFNFDLTQYNIILLFSILVIFIFLIKNLFLILILFFENFAYLEIKNNISSQIFYKILTQKFINQMNSNSAEDIRIISQDLDQAIQYFKLIVTMIKDIVIIFILIIVLIFGSSKFGFGTFLLFGLVSFLFLYKIRKRVSLAAHEILILKEKIIQKIQITLSGFKEIKIFNLEQIVFSKFLHDFYKSEKKADINEIIFKLT